MSLISFHSLDLFAATNTSSILVILKCTHKTFPAINSSTALDGENPISFLDATVK